MFVLQPLLPIAICDAPVEFANIRCTVKKTCTTQRDTRGVHSIRTPVHLGFGFFHSANAAENEHDAHDNKTRGDYRHRQTGRPPFIKHCRSPVHQTLCRFPRLGVPLPTTPTHPIFRLSSHRYPLSIRDNGYCGRETHRNIRNNDTVGHTRRHPLSTLSTPLCVMGHLTDPLTGCDFNHIPCIGQPACAGIEFRYPVQHGGDVIQHPIPLGLG